MHVHIHSTKSTKQFVWSYEAMAGEISFLELDVEEQLFAGVVHCSVEDCDALLKEIEDVDIRNSRQRTLLHTAVRLGKVDWVERLLGLGADPSIRDGNGSTVLEVAEEMAGKVSEDPVRAEILKLVRLASKIGGVWRERTKRNSEGGELVELKKPEIGAVSTEIAQGFPSKVNGLLREMKSFRGCVSQLRDEMRSKSSELSQQLLTSTLEISAVKEKVQSLKDDVTLLRESNGSVGSVVSALSGDVVSIKRTLEEVRMDVLSGKSETVSMAGRLLSLQEASDDIGSKLTSRDTLLEMLEVSVTSLAEKVSQVIKSLEEESDSEEEEEEAEGGVGTQVQAPALVGEEASRARCIETLMRKTWLFDGNEEDATRIRGLYARIYDEGPMTSSILTFLQSQEQFHVTIECDSADVYSSKESLDDDRSQCAQQSATMCTAVVNYSERQVHMRGKVKETTTEVSVIGFFARALTQMYIYLAFKNGGRPYHIGDRKEENMYESVMSDVVEKKVSSWLNWYVHDAVMNRDRNSKEIYLISAVPAIIAQDGLNNAFTTLRDEVPSLLDYYVDHVYVRLHRTVC